MAETLSPNSISIHKQKPQVTSPTSPFFLGSNDDKLERAAARAARAAAFRRKPIEVRDDPRNSLSSDSCLDRHQIMELFQNCVKLASENKINQKNTWELKLIDHLSEIIKVETESNNAETNFQKASCTLETGVKIYAVRVDAWHADAYRVLNGISRAGLEGEKDISIVSDRDKPDNKERDEARRMPIKVSPMSTVESSFEALNVKKFDVTFAVDPLYYQMSAQFDEGGAKGLLLYNLGVYGGCRVLFDSQEIPAKCMSPIDISTSSELVDVSFAKGCIELMAANLHHKHDISPSLRDLKRQCGKFDMPARVFNGMESISNPNENDVNFEFDVGQGFFSTCDAIDDVEIQLNNGSCDDSETWFADQPDYTTVSGEDINADLPEMQNCNEEPMQFMADEAVVSDSFENVAWLFCKGLGCKSARNAWAGPDHWTYSKRSGPENVSVHDSRSSCVAKRPKCKSSLEFDIEFTSKLGHEVLKVFEPVKNPKTLLLPPTRKVSRPNKLPEDCHYQPEDLVKLFLLPNIMCLGKIRRRLSGHDSVLQVDADESFSLRDNHAPDDPCVDDYIHRDAEEDMLVSEPRRVGKVEVEYDKTSKQVDLHVLKKTLWDLMRRSTQIPELKVDSGAVSFRHVLTAFPADCKAADTNDISPHLCFICLLHLANEHGLKVAGCPNMDDLIIHLSVACDDRGEVIQASLSSNSQVQSV